MVSDTPVAWALSREMVPAEVSRDRTATEIIVPEDLLALLRASGRLIDRARSQEAANHIYAEFGKLPGSAPFLYSLATRINSTARLIDFLVSRLETTPFDSQSVTDMFHAIGASHAHAGLPIALVELGPDVFASSLARVVTEHGGAWISGYTAAWRELMQQGVDIQRRAYTSPS